MRNFQWKESLPTSYRYRSLKNAIGPLYHFIAVTG